MRVAHVSTFHTSTDTRVFYKECRSLAAAGHEVHWIAPPPAPPRLDGVIYHPVKGCRYPYSLRRLLSSFAAALRQARRLSADLYHFHDVPLIPIGVLLRAAGARVVYDVHEDAVPQAISLGRDLGRPVLGAGLAGARWLLEATAKLSWSGFVCATPHIAGKFPRRRAITACNFPLMEEARELAAAGIPYRERPNTAAYVGGLIGIRGVMEMVRAIELVPGELSPRLLFAGELNTPELRRDVEQLPGWRRVEFLGWQQRDGVLASLGRSRIGLVVLHPRPNYQLAYPVKLFEYMAAALPVIASDFPVWRRIVEEAGCGLLVDPLDPRAIAEAITHLLSHPEEAEAMGRRGREAVLARYNWDSEAEKLLGLYERLAG